MVVAANRDERYNRQSRPPELVKHGECSFLRHWDDEKEGTWMGIAQDGWFVALTNQDDGKHDPHALTRGKVVTDCLHAGCHSRVAAILSGLNPARYNPFNLVFGRPGALFLARVWEGHELELVPLPQGINVISNDCWGVQYERKVRRVEGLAASVKSGWIVEVVDNLWGIMRDHDDCEDPFQSLCVHAEEHAFGTRSTSIITVSNQKDVMYWYSEGHPCQSKMLMCMGSLPHSE